MEQNELKIKLGGLPLPYVMMGYMLIVVGIVITPNYPYIMPVLIIIGIFLITLKERLLFNFDKKTMYKYSLLFFMKKGEYFDLSEASYISMIRVNITRQMNVLSITTSVNEAMIRSSIIFPDNKKMLLYRMKHEESMKFNKIIANKLNMKILDISSGQKVWIEPNNDQ
jgi:hypothetical protein